MGYITTLKLLICQLVLGNTVVLILFLWGEEEVKILIWVVKTYMQVSFRTSSFGAISVGCTRRSFPSLRSSRFRICAVSLKFILTFLKNLQGTIITLNFVKRFRHNLRQWRKWAKLWGNNLLWLLKPSLPQKPSFQNLVLILLTL